MVIVVKSVEEVRMVVVALVVDVVVVVMELTFSH